MHNAKCTLHNTVRILCVVYCAACLAACSIPNLDSPECAAARDVAKKYYSLAVGGDPMSHPEVLAKLKALRAPNFSASPAAEGDPYYYSSVPPTSYRADECSPLSDGRVKIEITVIWRVNDKNSIRKDWVTVAKSNDTWLVEHIDVGAQPQL